MNKNKQAIVPFLTFNGQAEEAITYYLSVFSEGKLHAMRFIDTPEFGEVGKVLHASFEIMGLQLMAMDMTGEQRPEFTWSNSLYVACTSEAQFDDLFAALSTDGVVMMGPEPVLSLRKVAWVTDKYQVTWQLIWE